MIVELGHFAAILALLLSLTASVSCLRGENIAWYARGIFVLLSLAFAAMIYAHVQSDFSVINVAENSHTLKPMLYKVTGVWGNHEGSMLLWAWVLALYGGAASFFTKKDMRGPVLGIQAALCFGFLCYLLLASNPFLRIFPAAEEGADLNPLLQDPGLAFHPPLLYLGYVGFSLCFAFAAAALIHPKRADDFLLSMRPWALIAWSFLTLGIALGSYWAYYELGWGGFWFWDPVENASLMPWLIGTALLHSVLGLKRGMAPGWTILLALFAFCFSLLGTFLVRSGIIMSVHAFANDPGRGVFLLALMGIVTIAVFALYALRAPMLRAGVNYELLSRETGLLAQALLLSVLCLTVFLGTLYPLILEILGGAKISVGAPYFARSFVPIAVPLLALAGMAAFLHWGGNSGRDLWQRSRKALFYTALAVLAVAGLFYAQPLMGILGLILAAWLIAGSVLGFKRGLAAPGALAHLGLGILTAGIAAASLWSIEDTARLKWNETMALQNWSVRLEKITEGVGPNYLFLEGRLLLQKDGEARGYLYPQKRYYPVQNMATSEVAREVRPLGDFYASIGDIDAKAGEATLHIAYKPLISWIWLGAAVMAAGGFWAGWRRLERAEEDAPLPPMLEISMIAVSAMPVYYWLGAPGFLLVY